MFVVPGTTYIGTLRATGSRHDPLALRVGLGRMLATAELHPSGLPRHAIVCIRKLCHPLPRCRQSPGGDLSPRPDWQRGIVTALEQLLRHAAHPGREAVPGHAEAVIFADYGDLLACLASDWCRGEAAAHWWWRSILRGQDVPGMVLRAWRESPEYVPAALQRLAWRGQAIFFVRMLPTGEAYTLVQSMTHRFALAELRASLEVREQPRRAGGGAVPPPTDPPQVASPSARQTALPMVPWQPWVPECVDHGLRFEHQCFLGIGLMLQRAPAIMRRPAFARAVQNWAWVAQMSRGDGTLDMTTSWTVTEDARRAPTDVGSVLSEPDQVGIGPRETSGRPWERVDIPALLVEESQGGADPRRDVGPVEPSQLTPLPWRTVGSVEPPQPSLLLSGALEEAAMAPTPVPISLATDQVDQSAPVALSATASALTEVIAAIPEWSNSGRASALDSPDLQIETGLGGLFYLINVGLFLNLYGDFTTPMRPGIELSLWDFVALLGQKLLGEAMQDDPVWGLLAHLSGRGEQVAPGANFEPPDIWRLPVEWLAPFPEEVIWRWQGTDGRLQVRHPAQFLVLDIPLQPVDPARQLRCALQDYGTDLTVEPQPEPAVANAGGTTLLERWLGWLMPYVRARLHRALQVFDPIELTPILCAHEARVFVTATHVDIFLVLDALPIEIRLAGLDRDPGWVPAAGRFIAFHFESALGVTSRVDESLC